jgi:drug/metabolite transporter (DMT)-like permease
MASHREPIFNWPIVICLVLLGAFGWAVRSSLNSVFDNFGFGTGMLVCAVSLAVIIAAAFSYDHLQARRSRQLQRPERNDFQPPET